MIYKINSNLPVTTKVENLNDQILEVDGKVNQSSFNKNEIDTLYTELGLNRKFLRNIALGNLTTDYTDWTHVHAELGYSIWKITPSTYVYNALNELYFNDKLVINKGEASSETAVVFDKVYVYDTLTYNDHTTEAGTEGGTAFSGLAGTGDYIYVGLSSVFAGIKFECYSRGSGNTLKVEYYNGSSGSGWVELTANDFGLIDNTTAFLADGTITWDATSVSDWETVAVNSVSKYWIRISTTTTPEVVTKFNYIIPTTSVIGVLALSSSEVLNEEWSWCTYNGVIYVTIRNAGNTAYDGDYYITSSSTDVNKKNFFVYNNKYTLNHEDSTYVAVTKLNSPDAEPADAQLSAGQVTFWVDEDASGGPRLYFKVKLSGSGTLVKSGSILLS